MSEARQTVSRVRFLVEGAPFSEVEVEAAVAKRSVQFGWWLMMVNGGDSTTTNPTWWMDCKFIYRPVVEY